MLPCEPCHKFPWYEVEGARPCSLLITSPQRRFLDAEMDEINHGLNKSDHDHEGFSSRYEALLGILKKGRPRPGSKEILKEFRPFSYLVQGWSKE